MRTATVSIIAGILIIAIPLTAAESKKKEPIKTNITIFGFDIRMENNDFQYYSSIIPRTLKKYLQNNTSYIIEIKNDEIITLNAAQEKEGSEELLKLMDSMSDKYPVPDLFIVGFMHTRENETFIDVIAYNTITGKSAVFPDNSIETGVLMQNSMDLFSTKLGRQIELFEKENIKLLTPSPYIPLYNTFSPFSFGVNAGRMFIVGPWHDIYNNAWFVTPHLRYDSNRLLAGTGFIFNAEFFSIDSEDKDVPSNSTMQVWNTYIDFEYTYPVRSHILLAFTAGAGTAFTRTRFFLPSGGGPDDPIVADVKTVNFSTDAACALHFDFSPFVFRLGVSYRRIFYTDQGFDGLSIMTGFDFHL
ncbi:MAG: hypothetical protein CVV44_16150 [Spirochaetae bacterium HGW-Spirochaetae-1]|jgi:hypothetical protein|nr:MAG: hypothetical protein CVV44_16150 [Spirochaetae bacterium HGW-Spirochaetae-1]